MTGPEQHANTEAFKQWALAEDRTDAEWVITREDARELVALAERADKLAGELSEWRNSIATEKLIWRAEAAEADRDRLQHIIDCADTPLMRDVLRERDRLARRVAELEDALRPFVEEYDFHAADYLANDEDARVFSASTVDLLIEHQRAARAALIWTAASTDNHEAASPLYRKERDRWLSECSCGWEQEAATSLEAKLAWENHKSAMDELAGDGGGA